MSAKPSKSELETALASRAGLEERKKKTRPDATKLQFDSMTGRRHKVIGGDLNGVLKRRKRRFFGNARDTNYISWITGGIVLMILGVFFWPHDSKMTTKEVTGRVKTVRSAPFYTESRVDQLKAETDQSFIRLTDIERAKEFRDQVEQEKTIRELTKEADTHLLNGEYTLPVDNNALANYRRILELDPNNIKARQGIIYINASFLNSGYIALKNNNERRAKSILIKLQSVDRQSEETIEFSAALEKWQKHQQIAKLMVQAEQAIKDKKLTLPARDNALFFYQKILNLDESNRLARQGKRDIVSTYIDKANEAIAAGEFKAASSHLTTASVIDPKHASIPLIAEIIATGTAKEAENISGLTGQTDATITLDETNRRSSSPSVSTARVGASSERTPIKEASEQAAFDKLYLQRGLDAYYQGEYETAAALLQPLADKGISRAQFRIAYMHYLGRGFDRDRKEADRMIRAALPAIQKFAQEGRSWAQSDLASLYEDGLVLAKSYREAIYWYRSAAAQGYPGAQTNLGIMYARGQGVASNRRTAIEWFQRAAKQGDMSAKRNLEAMGIEP